MPRITCLLLPLLVTVLFMFALRPVARGIGLIDLPGGRKNHIGEIPIIGGLAMLAGIIVGGVLDQPFTPAYSYFLLCSSILVIIGAWDDRYDLPASVRFLAQACAALIMIYAAGFVVKDLGYVFFGGLVQLGWFAPIFTLLIVLTAINAFNLFDGSDGVAGVQALISLVFFGFVCIMGGSLSSLPLIASLIGVVFGFLMFNWPSKRTRNVRAFMGDAGSTMLGFVLAWLSVDLSQGADRVISPIAVLWLFALPIFDLFSSMLRRMHQGRSPFHADSEHLHHVLRRFFNSSRTVAQVILLASACFAAVGVSGYLNAVNDGILLLTWLATGVCYHVVFGTNLFVKRRESHRDASGDITGSYQIWRQRP